MSGKSINLLFIIILTFTICGCTLAGKTFVAFVWTDPEIPTASFTSGIPGIPDDISQISKGAYYNVEPGNYTLSYSYTSGESHTLNLPIEANTPLLGKENAYYDIMLHKTDDPVLYKFPTTAWRN